MSHAKCTDRDVAPESKFSSPFCPEHKHSPKQRSVFVNSFWSTPHYSAGKWTFPPHDLSCDLCCSKNCSLFTNHNLAKMITCVKVRCVFFPNICNNYDKFVTETDLFLMVAEPESKKPSWFRQDWQKKDTRAVYVFTYLLILHLCVICDKILLASEKKGSLFWSCWTCSFMHCNDIK